MTEVVDLDRGVAPGGRRERGGGGSIRLRRHHVDLLERCERIVDIDFEGLCSVQTEGIGTLPLREGQGEDTHHDEVRPMDPLEALCDDRLDTQEEGSLGRPVP